MVKSLLLLLILALGDLHAELTLPSIFSGHMVLQCERPVPVWGKATPGAQVHVRFSGQVHTSIADAEGKWKVRLNPMPVSIEPDIMCITSSRDKQTVQIEDILVGEVWLCSGQSNMHYSMNGLATQNGEPTPIADEITRADYPLIRQMSVYSTLAPDEPQDDVGGKWEVCTPQNAGGFSATAYFFARELFHELDVPIGIIRCSWSGSPIQAWTRREVLMNNPVDRKYIEAKDEAERDFDAEAAHNRLQQWKQENAGKAPPGSVLRENAPPSKTAHYPQTLYNGMLSPIMPYAIRGAIWYQGEANAQRDQSLSYHWTLSHMIEDWRTQWGQGDFPFYFVQLANFRSPSKRPLDMDSWANVRESQLKTLAIPNTGMAVAIDIGEEKDVHPRNKIEVGRRLALWPLAKVYDINVVCSGPLYNDAHVEEDEVYLSFTEVADGLMVGQKTTPWSPVVASNAPLRQFQICGKDHKWVWADARIVSKDTVVVWSDSVPVPVAVRYAWSSNPIGCNLYNSAGLPASPFRTD
ncbi:MAG: sialate O-acetylesterase [Verrucomicrobiota bacterium JB024]|nr:sialate O-acetylesterase [Verrucomicrobiota bacterium JB024]